VTGASETGASETGSPETTWDEAGSNQTAFDEPGFEEPEFEEPGFEEPGPQVEPEAVAPEDATPEGASSGDPSGQESIVHPRVWQRRVAVLREQAHRRLRWVVAGVAVLVALCVAVLALHTPLLALRHATVRGAEHTGTEAVLQAAGLLDHPPLIDVDPDSVATRVEKLPWVAHAVVVRRWPDSVTIIVTERVSLGTMARPGGGVAVVDSSGRVLAWQADAVPGLVLVAPVTPGRPGTVLARAAHPALQVAAALPPVLAGQVLEVSANAQGMVTLELGGGISAVLGSTDGTQAKLTALASVLAGAHVSGPAVIDVTVPDEPTVGPPPPGSRP
jgi:cell division protein FtsQ